MRWTSFFGTPGGIRTPDPLVRSQILYPAELLAHRNKFRLVLNRLVYYITTFLICQAFFRNIFSIIFHLFISFDY